MATLREMIEPFAYRQLEFFADLIDRGGEDTEFYGIRVLDEPEKFVHGSLVEMTMKLYVHYVETADARAEDTLRRVHKFLGYVIPTPCRTWGKLDLLRGMAALKEAGLEDRIDAETVAILREKTRYDDFFDKENLTLRGGYPTNYVQVAMACAGYRELLGWENEGMSEKIREKLLTVMRDGSASGWMDEEPPYGRFDRYSLLVTSELSDNLSRFGAELPEFAQKNLRDAAKICLFCANARGDGINYGRSLSCHGDGAAMEILGSALARGLVDAEDVDTAVLYAQAVTRKMLQFWFDAEKNSFNIWWDGRTTNRYRQVHRVLEVNLDMVNHLLTVLHNFTLAGLDNYEPRGVLPSPRAWQMMRVRFAAGEHHVCETLIFRRGDILAMLPLIGLGRWYNKSAYQPFPAVCGAVEAPPESTAPFFVPEYADGEGLIYRPIQYYDSVEADFGEDEVCVRADGRMCRMGEGEPTLTDLPFHAVFRLVGERITVRYTADGPFCRVRMAVGTHTGGAQIQPDGFAAVTDMPAGAPEYDTPHGALTDLRMCEGTGDGEYGYTVCL